MRYRLADLPKLAATPLGRRVLGKHVYFRTWPALRAAATAHRRTLARSARVITVVGSVGKTTTTKTVAAALGLGGLERLRGGSYSKLAVNLLRVRPGQPHAVFEVAIDGKGQMERYASMLRPDIVVVTAIASEHQRSLGSLETTRAEKACMLDGLRPGGTAVLNGDDPNVRWMAGRTGAEIITIGLGEDNDLRATEVRVDWPHGTRFRLHAAGAEREMCIRLVGRKMVYPALAAVAVALKEGRSLDGAVNAIEAVEPVAGRMQPVALPGGSWLLRDEFKAPLESVDAALDALEELPGRKIVVLGEVSEPPGSQGPIYRRLGERIAGTASRAIFIGGVFQRLAAGARRAGMPRDAIVDAGRSPRRAADAVMQDLRPGDIVLVKGRDTQRLARVALALQGRTVGCDIEFCNAVYTGCEMCPMLERGWGDHQVIT
jgi:UDP-N-acetylmuramoyl-tripeptide--D-alanyl-D-alanine ligase